MISALLQWNPQSTDADHSPRYPPDEDGDFPSAFLFNFLIGSKLWEGRGIRLNHVKLPIIQSFKNSRI